MDETIQQPVNNLTVKDGCIFLMYSLFDREVNDVYVRVQGMDAFLKQHLHHEARQTKTHPLLNAGRTVSSTLWEEVPGGLRTSRDLSPTVASALNWQREPADSRHAIPAIRLTPVGSNLLNGVYCVPAGNPAGWSADEHKNYRHGAKGLSLQLSGAAQRRMQTQATELRAEIRNLYVLFPSELRLVLLELTLASSDNQPVSAIAFEEAVHILGHQARVRDCRLAAFVDAQPIALTELLSYVIPNSRFFLQALERSFSYIVIVLNQLPRFDAAGELAFRCARHYTADYRLNTDQNEIALYRPFSSLVHAFSLEGAATVVDNSDTFLSDQFLTRATQTYLWLVVLAFHEHSYLLSLIARFATEQKNGQQQLSAFRALIAQFLDFRLRHRLALVSQISMHNETYRRIRSALLIENLIHKVTNDLVEIERWLLQEEQVRRESDRRIRQLDRERAARRRHMLRPLEIAISALLMFGVTYLSFDTLVSRIQKIHSRVGNAHVFELLLVLCVSLVAAALRGWQVYHQIEEEPEMESPEDESGTDETLAIAVGGSTDFPEHA